MLVISDKLEIPLRELKFTFAKSSGPGGQNTNKVSTKAQLKWNVVGSPSLSDSQRQRIMDKHRNKISKAGILTLQSERFRDQGRNVADCLEKLTKAIRMALHKPKKRVATKPTKGSIERRIKDKKAKSQKKNNRGKVKHGVTFH